MHWNAQRRLRSHAACIAAALLSVGIGSALGATGAEKCAAAKIKAGGKKVYGKAKCHQKAILNSATVDPACLLKVETKFAIAVAKANLLGSCQGTAVELETTVDDCIAALAAYSTCTPGQPCDTGNLGVCAAGTTGCTGGVLVCNQNVPAYPEAYCDGLDNDCNGSVDEGNPEGGAVCDTGNLGACGAGTTVCTGGAVVCNQNMPPTPETCDGIDNDCDGTVDTGTLCPPMQSCIAGTCQ